MSDNNIDVTTYKRKTRGKNRKTKKRDAELEDILGKDLSDDLFDENGEINTEQRHYNEADQSSLLHHQNPTGKPNSKPKYDNSTRLAFGATGLWQPPSLFRLMRERRSKHWKPDKDLLVSNQIGEGLNSMFSTVGSPYKFKSSLVRNTAMNVGSWTLLHYHIGRRSIADISAEIEKIAPIYKKDRLDGTNMHIKFFGKLDHAIDDYRTYLDMNIVVDKSHKGRIPTKIEESKEFQKLAHAMRWIGITKRESVELALMVGLTIDSKLSPDDWELYEYCIPNAYKGALESFIESISEAFNYIIKNEL